MNALTNEQQEQLTEVNDAVVEAKENVELVVEEYNEALDDLPDIEAPINDLNTAIKNFNDFCEEVADELEEYFDDQEEEWQESPEGQRFSDWMEKWQNEEMEDADTDELGQVAQPLVPGEYAAIPTLSTSP
jgi:chromosome segregation ATPase